MPINYQELGFKCGLEIHQQLEGKKLFCNCPTLNSDKESDIKIERRLRAVAGETGIVDIAAQFEMSKKRKFFYESSSEDTCLIEYDEEPPREMNKKALETTIKIALLLNAKIVDEIQIMRKTVVDGSNVSGFQRTALVAMDGHIKTEDGSIVKMPTICLEEEAAQKLGETKEIVRYKLNRLGIPLIEIATDASIKTPEHAKEVAAQIGMILRSVEGIKRGLGTIRQDVNISIEDGARTEIKGFQDLKSIPKVVEYEVNRQIESIKQNRKLEKEVRKAENDFTTSFLRPLPGAARLYPETDVLPVKADKHYIEKIRKELPKLLNERVKDYTHLYGIGENMAKQILRLNYNFESILNYSRVPIIEEMQKNLNYINKIISTIKMPSIQFDKIIELSNNIKHITESALIPLKELERFQEQLNMTRNVLAHSTVPFEQIFNKLENISKLIDLPKITIRTLTSTLPEIEKEGVDTKNITENDLKEVLRLVAEDKISKEAIPEILKDLDKGKQINEIVDKYALISEKELEEEIKKIIDGKPGLNESAYMGLAMAKYRGKVDGKKVMEIIKKLIA